MDHEGNVELDQQGDARILHPRGVQDDTIHRATRFQLAIDALFVVIGDDGQKHVIPIARVDLTRARDEIGKNRVHDLMPGGKRDHVAHGHGAAGRQTYRARIRLVVVSSCRRRNPFARGFIHLGIAVQCPAHRGGGQIQLPGKLLQVHDSQVQTVSNFD